MPLANKCRDRALLLLELAEEAPAFKVQLVSLAESWLTAAALMDLFKDRVDQIYKPNTPN